MEYIKNKENQQKKGSKPGQKNKIQIVKSQIDETKYTPNKALIITEGKMIKKRENLARCLDKEAEHKQIN